MSSGKNKKKRKKKQMYCKYMNVIDFNRPWFYISFKTLNLLNRILLFDGFGTNFHGCQRDSKERTSR